AIGKKKKIKKKHHMPDFLEDIAKETFSRKLALILSESKTIDYGNKKIEQQILIFLNSIKEEGQMIKEEEEEKQYTINKILKEAQGAEGMKNKNTKKVRQEDRLEPEDEKVYFTIWNLPNRIFKKQGRSRVESNERRYQKKTRSKLGSTIKERSVSKNYSREDTKIGAGYSNTSKLGAIVVTKNIAIKSGFSSIAKKDKKKELRVLE
ncbi:12499_t:CDS:2, partial [Gigaspora margarita]